MKCYCGVATIKSSWECKFWQHCSLSCATVLLDITFLQNVGEQLTQQHTKSSQKTGIFILNTFEDYLLSVNWLMFERLFTWTYVWHTIPTAMSVLDQHTWSLPRSLMLTRWCVMVSQLPVATLSAAWHVSWPAACHCTVSSLTCWLASSQSLHCQQPDVSVGQLPVTILSVARWIVTTT